MKNTYKRVEIKCCDCGTPITIAETKIREDIRKYGKPGDHRCKECLRKWRSSHQKEWYNSLSDKDKESVTSGMRNFWETASNDRKDKIKKDNSIRIKNMSAEERARISILESNAAKNYWSSLSDEEKNIKFVNMSNRGKKYWANLSENERAYLSKRMSDGWKKKFNKLSIEDLKNYTNKRRDIVHKYWNNLPESEKMRQTKAKLTVNHGKNKFHQTFENRFNMIFKESFSLKEEFSTSKDGIIHFWDYAVFNLNNELVMLIDLDGIYFHADYKDYNGIHSKEEYDEKRGLSNNDVFKFIIYENNFDKSFNHLIKLLSINHVNYNKTLFSEYRAIPFPELCYTDDELTKSYEELYKMNCDDKYHQDISLNTRLGDHLIQHFHPSIYHDKRAGKLSPYEAWNNDNILRSMITQGYLYHSYLNKNKILQGFNIYEPAQRVSILSAGKAKMIIDKYLNKYDEVFDPFSGYGGIMLACIAMNKRYVGQDVSEVHTCESLNMIQFLKDNGVDMDASLSITDSSQTTGTYQCLITEVPSGDEECQDVVNIYTSDEWVDLCMRNYKCNNYVFIVKNTERYVDKIVDTIYSKNILNNNEYILLM